MVVSDTISNLLMFSPMYLITKGGPNKSTNVLMYEAYKSTFAYADYGSLRLCSCIADINFYYCRGTTESNEI